MACEVECPRCGTVFDAQRASRCPACGTDIDAYEMGLSTDEGGEGE